MLLKQALILHEVYHAFDQVLSILQKLGQKYGIYASRYYRALLDTIPMVRYTSWASITIITKEEQELESGPCYDASVGSIAPRFSCCRNVREWNKNYKKNTFT